MSQIGHNNPPEPTPYERISADIEALMETAKGYLDGKLITTKAVADDVGKLIDAARKARQMAENERKLEAKPFDEGKAAVQALWTPLTDEKKGKCALIIETAKAALIPWVKAEQKRIDDEAAKARQIADEAAAKARMAQKAASDDLAARESAERAIEDAARLTRNADKLDGAKATVAGGARAVSVRTHHIATLTDPAAALRYYREHHPNDLKAWLADQGQRDCLAGLRNVPGFTYSTETRVQ